MNDFVKNIYGTLLCGYSKVFGMDAAKKFDTRFRFGRKLNLKEPKSLADKVTYIELHEQSPLASTCTDKYAVREYVSSKGLEDILVPLAGGPWENAAEIDFDALPDDFVIKATHGCKMNYLVPNKSELDQEDCRKTADGWLKVTYGTYSMEPHYAKIKPRLYAERYLGDMSGLTDYKFHCLNGKPMFVLALTDRKVIPNAPMQVTMDLFDMEWKPIDDAIVGFGDEKAGCGNVPKPECFEKMCEVAEILSADFKFVRVDLYEKDGKVLFGELTFSPACCVFPYLSQQFLDDMGENLKI